MERKNDDSFTLHKTGKDNESEMNDKSKSYHKYRMSFSLKVFCFILA